MKNRKNLPLALLTSFLVLILGGALWGLVYYYNIFSAWISFIAVFCAGLCYTCFYRKTNWVFYVWLIVLSVGINLAAMFISLAFKVQLVYDCTFSEALKLLPENLAYAKNAVIVDVVFSVVFTIVGVIFAFVSNKYRKEKSIKPEGRTKVKPVPVYEESVQLNTQDAALNKIANYCLKNYIELLKLEENERNLKMAEFDEKTISKLDAISKQTIAKILNEKSFNTEIERVAAQELMKKLK